MPLPMHWATLVVALMVLVATSRRCFDKERAVKRSTSLDFPLHLCRVQCSIYASQVFAHMGLAIVMDQLVAQVDHSWLLLVGGWGLEVGQLCCFLGAWL